METSAVLNFCWSMNNVSDVFSDWRKVLMLNLLEIATEVFAKDAGLSTITCG